MISLKLRFLTDYCNHVPIGQKFFIKAQWKKIPRVAKIFEKVKFIDNLIIVEAAWIIILRDQ